MKRLFLLIFLGLICINIFAEAEIVSCDGDAFKGNSCTVCIDGGEASVDNDSLDIQEEMDITWKNASTDVSNIFYRDSQNERKLITNIGTIDPEWEGGDIIWKSDIIWEDTDINKTYTIDAGGEEVILTIPSNMSIGIKDIQKQSPGNILLKIPVTYVEFNFSEIKKSDPKTINYCVSYTPKVLSSGTAATTTAPKTSTATTSTTATPAPAKITAPITTTTPTVVKTTTQSDTKDTSLDIDTLTSAEDSEQVEEVIPEETHDTAPEETPEIVTPAMEEPTDSAPEIVASYTSDVSSQQVAEENMVHNAASEVPTGPVSNILILLAISSLIGYFVMFRTKAF